jgi:hypothetical protein
MLKPGSILSTPVIRLAVSAQTAVWGSPSTHTGQSCPARQRPAPADCRGLFVSFGSPLGADTVKN